MLYLRWRLLKWTIIVVVGGLGLFAVEHSLQAQGAGVVLNEILPEPDDGGYEWVELYNAGSQPVDLEGWYIQSNSKAGQPVVISSAIISPAATTLLEPGALLVVFLPESHLGNWQDTVRLVSSDDTIIDAREYNSITAPGSSHARVPDGGAVWQVRSSPSPGSLNAAEPTAIATPTDTPIVTSSPSPVLSATPTATPTEPVATPADTATTTPEAVLLRLNELLPAPSGGQAEWVELVNRATEPVALQGWVLERVSAGGTTRRVVLTGDVVLPAAGYAVVNVGTSFLPNDGGWLYLLDPQGRTVDAVVYPALGANAVYARVTPDGDAWRTDYPPSPGQPNLPPDLTAAPTATKTSTAPRTARPSHTPTPTRTLLPALTNTPTHTPLPDSTITPAPATTATARPTATSEAVLLHLNELLPAPSSGQAEWVELVNRATEPVALQGWVLERVSAGGTTRRVVLTGDVV
ncbi:MAG: hypothetical protein HC876_17325, partial [Chloroflexaceae bacterium]|nr:hypothetical protein [Chloroflexaceae bacterium]